MEPVSSALKIFNIVVVPLEEKFRSAEKGLLQCLKMHGVAMEKRQFYK